MSAERIAELEALEVGVVESHFLDSGAFSQWTKAAEYAKDHDGDRWAYYDSAEHYEFLDKYAAFVKEYAHAIDLYANVDVIPTRAKNIKAGEWAPDEVERAEQLSWRNQRYFEKHHGLQPVPVVHYRANLKWLTHYIERNYELIALGGLVGSTSKDGCQKWIDRCFDLVCQTPDRTPCVNVHGFGITNWSLLLRYPWWSVDSTSWTKVGAYGGILVPHRRKGRFTFNEQPYLCKVSVDSPDMQKAGRHAISWSDLERKVVLDWLQEINVPYGSVDAEGQVTEFGVSTRHTERRAANLIFFERMRASLPEYPWAFRRPRSKGFGIEC